MIDSHCMVICTSTASAAHGSAYGLATSNSAGCNRPIQLGLAWKFAPAHPRCETPIPPYHVMATHFGRAGRRRKTAQAKAAIPSRTPTDQPSRRRRRQFCDCGRVAVTVKLVKVGSDPQYTIRLPLCKACLKLEQEIQQDLE